MINMCECGCGETTERAIRLLREQDRGKAEALAWRPLAIGPMRVRVACVAGHDQHLIGYIADEPAERDACRRVSDERV